MGRLSRRLFLRETLLAAAAAGAPALPAAEPAESAKQSKSPNERLSVAVIGARIRGREHAAEYAKRDDCFLSYICDADSAIGEEAAAKLKSQPKVVQDMRRVFDDKSVNVVSIATPDHWHALAAIRAMQAGKHVYVEKPVSHNVAEGRRMVQAARKYDRICQAGLQYRSSGVNREALQYVAKGNLGRVVAAHVRHYFPRPAIGPAGAYAPPKTVDYDLWSGPAPRETPIRRKAFHYDWHWFWDYAGGELANGAIHLVDAARMIAGLKGLGRGVMSYGGRLGLTDDCGQTPNVQVTIHDFGAVTVVQEVRGLKTAFPRPGSMVIIGTAGYLAGGTVYDPQGNVVEQIPGRNVNHFDNFIQAVRNHKPQNLNADIAEGHVSSALVHVANISQRLGKPASSKEIQAALEAHTASEDLVATFDEIREHLKLSGVEIAGTPLRLGPWLAIDSDQERFVDHPAADALLTREYRKPFVVPGEKEL